MSENAKVTAPAPAAGTLRSKRLRTIICVSGIGAAGVGLIYLLTGKAHVIDIVLLAGGLLVTVAGLTLSRSRNPGT